MLMSINKANVTGSLLGGSNVKINGIVCDQIDLDYMESKTWVHLPSSLLSKPGKYPVVIESLYGNSNIVYFTVDNPVIHLAPVPEAPVINPEFKDREPLKKAIVKPSGKPKLK